MSDISFGRSVISTGWSGSITGGRSEEEHYGPEQRREGCHIKCHSNDCDYRRQNLQ